MLSLETGACLVDTIFICMHDKWQRRFSLLRVVVSDRFLKAVACSALGALGGKGNVALCLESEMGLHASQHVSSHRYPFCPVPLPLPASHLTLLPPFPWPSFNIIRAHVNQTSSWSSEEPALIVSSSTAKSLLPFLAGLQPTSCLCVLFIFFFVPRASCSMWVEVFSD